jgi:ketosteroid isomerase-like protein
MSQENVEVVRGFYEAFGRGDLELARAVFDPRIVAFDHDIPTPVSTEAWKDCFVGRLTGRPVGKAGVWDPEELIEAGDRVVAVLRVHARGRGSGVDVERVDGTAWTLQDSKCIRLDYYGSGRSLTVQRVLPTGERAGDAREEGAKPPLA